MGHHIIEINGTSTVSMQHGDVVHLLSSTVGDVSHNNYFYCPIGMVVHSHIVLVHTPVMFAIKCTIIIIFDAVTPPDNARPYVQTANWKDSCRVPLIQSCIISLLQ